MVPQIYGRTGACSGPIDKSLGFFACGKALMLRALVALGMRLHRGPVCVDARHASDGHSVKLWFGRLERVDGGAFEEGLGFGEGGKGFY